MYILHFSKKFRKDFKKISKNPNFRLNELEYILYTFKRGGILEDKYRNHKLHGIWLGYCECHVRPNILLIYEINEQKKKIYIDRLGSHSDLF